MWPFTKKTQTSPDGEAEDIYQCSLDFPLGSHYTLRVLWNPIARITRFELRGINGSVHKTIVRDDTATQYPPESNLPMSSLGFAADLERITKCLPPDKYGNWSVDVGLSDAPDIQVTHVSPQMIISLPQGDWGKVFGLCGPIYLDRRGAWCPNLPMGAFHPSPDDGIDWDNYRAVDVIADIFPILIQQFDLDPRSLLHTYSNAYDGKTYVRKSREGAAYTHTMTLDVVSGLFVFTQLREPIIPEGMAIALLANDVGNLAKRIDTNDYAHLSEQAKVALREKITTTLVNLVVASTQTSRMPDAIEQARMLLKLIPSLPTVYDDVITGL